VCEQAMESLPHTFLLQDKSQYYVVGCFQIFSNPWISNDN